MSKSAVTAAAAVAASNATAPSVPRALLRRLYRQLLRSSTLYGTHASLRSFTVGGELHRFLSSPTGILHGGVSPFESSSASPSSSSSSSPSSTSSTDSIRLEIENWIKKRPNIFKEINREYKRNNKTTTTIPIGTHPNSSTDASSQLKSHTTSSTPANPSSPSSSGPLSSTAAPFFHPHSPPAPPPPRWSVSAADAGLNSLTLDPAWLRRLIAAAFRRPATAKELASRMSNGFALHKRFHDRAGELALLPVSALTSLSESTLPCLLKVRMRSLGLFKAHRGSFWFQVEWRVANIGDKTLVLQSRTLKTHERLHAAAGGVGQNHPNTGDKHARLLGACVDAGASSDVVRRSPLSPASLAPSVGAGQQSTSSTLGGVIVSSTGIGLRGRPIGLPPGAGIERELSTVHLDTSIGILSAELRFLDYSLSPPKEILCDIGPILLDAYAPLPSTDLPFAVDSRPAYVPPIQRSKHEVRDLLTGALRIETRTTTREGTHENNEETNQTNENRDTTPNEPTSV